MLSARTSLGLAPTCLCVWRAVGCLQDVLRRGAAFVLCLCLCACVLAWTECSLRLPPPPKQKPRPKDDFELFLEHKKQWDAATPGYVSPVTLVTKIEASWLAQHKALGNA